MLVFSIHLKSSWVGIIKQVVYFFPEDSILVVTQCHDVLRWKGFSIFRYGVPQALCCSISTIPSFLGNQRKIPCFICWSDDGLVIGMCDGRQRYSP